MEPIVEQTAEEIQRNTSGELIITERNENNIPGSLSNSVNTDYSQCSGLLRELSGNVYALSIAAMKDL